MIAKDQNTGHDQHAGHDHSVSKDADTQSHEGHDAGSGSKTKPIGQLITEKKVENYSFSYYLLNKEERNQTMKSMEGMDMPGMLNSPDVTNHLMVYVKGHDGKYLSGKIGFKITGPDGKEFKTMTMGMYGGYGADVIFKGKGVYKVATKASIDGKNIKDELTYEMK